MKVFYNSRSQHVMIDVDSSMTVESLKNQLQNVTGVDPAYQEIMSSGKKLRNMQTFGHYKLSNDDVVEMHMHMNGGCSESCSLCCCSEGCNCTIC